MTTHRWRTTLTVQGLALHQDVTVPVITGLINTPAGGVHIALQVADDQPVILTVQDARQLAHNLTDMITKRLKITAENLGKDDSQDNQP